MTIFKLCVSLSVALALVACKGDTKYQDTPETVKALGDCRDKLGEKDKYIADLEARLGEAERTAAAGAEVVVNVQGDVLAITGKGPVERKTSAPTAQVDDKKLYEAFLASIRASKGAMKKCYQNALKRDPSLQAGSTTVTVSVKFDKSGKVSTSGVNPKINDTFAGCMTGVAKTLTIPPAPIEVTFKAPVELTPE